MVSSQAAQNMVSTLASQKYEMISQKYKYSVVSPQASQKYIGLSGLQNYGKEMILHCIYKNV